MVFYCNECKTEQYLEGFWIGCVERHSQYLFDEDLFMFFDYLQKFNPGMSMLGFLHTLEEFSAEKNRVRNRFFISQQANVFPPKMYYFEIGQVIRLA